MLLRTRLFGKTYEFPDLRLLMGKANEEKSGDRLAGVAAESRSRTSCRPVWSWPKCRSGRSARSPQYRTMRTRSTRVIRDEVSKTVYAEIRDWTVGELHEWLLADSSSGKMIRRVSAGLTAEMVAAVTKLMSNLDLVYGTQKLRVTAHCANTIG